MPAIEAVEIAKTVRLETVKVELTAPAGTVTLSGTVATSKLLLTSVTVAPPVGAAPVKLTVPCEGVPPVTLVGLSVTDDSPAAFGKSVSVAFLVEP